MRTVMRQAERGYSLVELLIVIGVAAVLLSILTVGFRQASDAFALRRAGGITVSEVRRAQALAVSQRRDAVVEFALGSPPGLTVYRFTDGGTWEQVRLIRPPSAGGGMDGEWPASVNLVAAATSPFSACGGSLPGAGANQCVKFNLFGEPALPAASGQIVLRNSSGSELRVVVAPATGRVSVER